MTATKMLVEVPADDQTSTRQLLGYIEAYDAPLNSDYAMVAYKETDRSSGDWRIRIKGLQITGVVFEPAAMKSQARAAGAQGKPYFTWGNTMEPSAGDPRHIEYRVHVKGGQPSEIEMLLRLRKFDNTPDEAKACRFAWPQ